MNRYRNDTGISLSVAAYLAYDEYDYDDSAISATALIKPIKPTILSKRVPEQERVVDIAALLKSRIGTSIHDSVERVWTTDRYKHSLKLLGYPEKMINRIVVNPTEKPNVDSICVYSEIRQKKEIDGFTISGKFDLVIDGRLEDIKSTSTFVYMNQTKVDDYRLQGSIYRWLNPEIITNDYMAIQYIFTDYMPVKAYQDNYPPAPVIEQKIGLLSLPETEAYIRNKLRQIAKYSDKPEEEIPRCTDEELWRKPPQYKYYKNPDKMTRSTKNFDDLASASRYQMEQNGQGVIVTKPGEVVACKYCPAFSACTQKNEYIADGSLKV